MNTLPAAIAISHDGAHVLASIAGALWDEAAREPLGLRPGATIAATAQRAWTIRDGTLHSWAFSGSTHGALAVGDDAEVCAAGHAVIASGSRGTFLVRDRGEIVELAPHKVFARGVGEHRFFVDTGSDRLFLETAAQPRALGVHLTASVRDAASVLDRSTFVLLLERGPNQELAVMRSSGTVLVRIAVANVAHIAAGGHRVALATGDGRVIVYDLAARTVVSADRLSCRAVPIAMTPDGTRLVGVTDGVVERRLAPAP